LIDYKAFRRGDRFYVKISLADFSAAAPHFRADGFEDVQVQKVGDSSVVSFKLQPGASARVDQYSNRLDVVFSAPNKNVYNSTANAGSNRTSSQNSAAGPDWAGPMPPGSDPALRGRVVSSGSVNEDHGLNNPSWPTNPPSRSNRNSNSTGNTSLTASNTPVTSPSPLSSPSSILAPGTSSSYPPPITATSATPTKAKPAAGSSESAARKWISENRLATLLGAVILLTLILYLATFIRRRQAKVARVKRAGAPKVQPKYSASDKLSELPAAEAPEKSPRRGSAAQQPLSTPSAASALPNHPWILTKPTLVSPTASLDEYSREEEEREVFEL
jgi:hypothetical protein